MLAGALELFLVSLGLTYYVATVGAGLRVIRRARKARREQAAIAAAAAGPASVASRSGRAARSGPGARSGSRHRPAPRRGTRGARARGLDPADARGAGAQGSGSAADLAASVSAGWGRLRTRLETADEPAARAGLVVPPEDCVVYFLIPCLNEELVIGDTVRSLLADSRGLVVVVDDGSDDRTAELAAAAGGDRAMVVRRELPDARRGKGPALNVGFAEVLHDAGVRGIPASRITVCVMDADGRLSEGALDVVLPLFEDPRVGGVQLPVRIRNRTSLLTVMQDLEFWGVCAVAQLGRMACGTVSLGGNGQFTRLAALLEMGPAPWRAQLTEDLDLSLALAAKGWRLTSAPDAHVSQQGVTSLRALVNQRTRWYQGHMQAVRWLRELWTSRQLSHLGMLELTIYLLVPWALVLPWSIIFNYNLLIMVLWVLGWVATPGLGSDLTQKIATLVFWYTLSCLPIYMAGFLYGRQERKVGYLRAFFIGHLLLVGNYVTYIACWRAMYRLITGVHGWDKTRRTDERRTAEPARVSPVPAFRGPALPVRALPVPALPLAALPAPALAGAESPATWRSAAAGPVPVLAAAVSPAAGRPAALATAGSYLAGPAGPALDADALGVTTRDTAVLNVIARDSEALDVTAREALDVMARDSEALDVTAHLGLALDAGSADAATWAAGERRRSRRSSGPVTARSAGLHGRGSPARSGPATSLGLLARVPWPRRPAPTESHVDPAPGCVDQDAVTADLPVITAPPEPPAVSTARPRDAWADDPETYRTWAREIWGSDATAGRARTDELASTSAAGGGAAGVGAANGAAAGGGAVGGGAAGGGDGLVRELPGRRPGSRSGHGQSRRVAGSHRAARARSAQHSGR